MSTLSRLLRHSIFWIIATFLLTGALTVSQAQAADYTVCDSGCDFTTFTQALQVPGLGSPGIDTITLSNGYTFDDSLEDDNLYLSNNITITCESGADIMGDQTATQWFFGGASNVTWQDCTFENVAWDFTNTTGVDFLNNTYTANPSGSFTLTNSFDVNISGNTDMQRIQIQTAHDVTIENNTFACRFDNTCIYIGVAGGPDYSNPVEVSGNILVQNNTVTNYITNNGGDWIAINGGNDIVFQNNIVRSAVTMDDVYLTMISLTNGQADFKNNYIIQPPKNAPQTAASVAFNIRTDVYDTTALYEHNTIIRVNGDTPGANQNSCFTLFDNGGHSNIPINITANYNLCDQEGNTASGQGFQLIYVLGSSEVIINDSFNGFSNIAEPISDNTNTHTTVNPNTELRNALLRRENVDTSDDWQPSPVSVYLDADGTTDIGAFSGVRSTETRIDPGCTVDYSTCHAQSIDILTDSHKAGDTAILAPGTYTPFTLSNLSNLNLVGNGVIVDGAGSFAAVLNNITDSVFSGFTFANATNSITTYSALFQTLTKNSIDYNFAPVVLVMEPGCSPVPIAPNTVFDPSSLPGFGIEEYNLFLVHVPNVPDEYYTVLTRASVASVASDITTICGIPSNLVEGVVTPFFSLSGNEYTLNTAGMASEGITVTGSLPYPYITSSTTSATALILNNSSGNTFTDITASGNSEGVLLNGTSTDNRFENSNLSNNLFSDIVSTVNGDNVVSNSLFDRTKTTISNGGTIIVSYLVQALVKNRSTSVPLENASVTFRDAQSQTSAPSLTDVNGLTPPSEVTSMILSQGNVVRTAGGRNPFTVLASKANFQDTSVVEYVEEPNQVITVTLPVPPTISTTPPRNGGSGGGFAQPTLPSQGGNSSTGTTPGSDGTLVPGQTHGSAPEIPTNPDELLKNFPGFPDLDRGDPSYIAFAYTYAMGAFTGDADGDLYPKMYLQRDQIAKLVAVSIFHIDASIDYCNGKAPFPDVSLDNWASQYICFAKNKGIVTGYEGEADKGMYKPERIISRAEFVAILTRALPDLKTRPLTGNYSDIIPGPWYVDYAAIAHSLQLFPVNSSFLAKEPVRRYEAARILYSLHLRDLLK